MSVATEIPTTAVAAVSSGSVAIWPFVVGGVVVLILTPGVVMLARRRR